MKDELNFRPSDSIFSAVYGQQSFVDFNGAKWREQKRFVMRCFRGCGLGKSTMVDHVVEESKHLIAGIKEHLKPGSNETTTVDVTPFFFTASFNMINTLIFGHRIDRRSAERKEIDRHVEKMFTGFTNTGLLTVFPQLGGLLAATKLFGWGAPQDGAKGLKAYFK